MGYFQVRVFFIISKFSVKSISLNCIKLKKSRRFSEIREEHEKALKKFPEIKKAEFPPRSPFNKTDTFQIERQQKLEQYLKSLIQVALTDIIHDFSASTKRMGAPDTPPNKLNKDTFCDQLSFFAETTEDRLNVQKLGWKSGDDFKKF